MPQVDIHTKDNSLEIERCDSDEDIAKETNGIGNHANIKKMKEEQSHSNCNETNENIIRKLGIIETYFHNEIEKDSSINISTILIKSKVSLFQHKKLFNKAVKLWMKTQPLLRSKVVRLDDTDEKAAEYSHYPSMPGFNKYFATMDEKEFQKVVDNDEIYLNNINYLYYTANEQSKSSKLGDKESIYEDCHDFWKFIIEREITLPIDWQNGPMWRFNLIHIKRNEKIENEKDLVYDYGLITSCSHAIFDGTSIFASIVSMFTILEYLFQNIKNQESINEHIVDAKVVHPVEICTMNYLEQTNKDYNKLGEYNKLGGFKPPSKFIIKDELERKSYLPLETCSKELLNKLSELKSAGFYSDITDQMIVSLNDLVEISEKSVTKFHLTQLDGEKYKLFLSKCKSKGVKVTGVFNTMFILAWRMTYKKFTEKLATDGIMDEKIQYLTIVSMRSFLKEIDISSLVWLCNNLYTSFEDLFDLTNENEFWDNKFWEFAKKESQQFHERIKIGEHFRMLETSKPIEQDETRLHYGLSNLLVPVELTQDIKLFKINQLYTLTSYRKDWTNDFSYNNIISMGDKMCWTISFNSYYVNSEIIDFFRSSVLEIYEKICQLK